MLGIHAELHNEKKLLGHRLRFRLAELLIMLEQLQICPEQGGEHERRKANIVFRFADMRAWALLNSLLAFLSLAHSVGKGSTESFARETIFIYDTPSEENGNALVTSDALLSRYIVCWLRRANLQKCCDTRH